ncbi:hypothetical protein P43SY_001108 [Pythium insidiosum]|uniref:Sm domain-containing protein n=1 Tax=Pythium insidiosum TaxID=114742 RepID=A0AAD5QBT9_PYTIN|nr:hypothetical protein P43SY_001108 [Pythium insidiosum]
MASNLKELMNQNISIITNDGRNIIGVLKGYDQCINVVLDNSFERVYSLKEPVEAVELGLYIVRGDNIAVIGEVSEDSAFVRRNWLEENCGDVPTTPRVYDDDVSEMLRGGHALQIANAKMLEAKLASAARGAATSFSETQTAALQANLSSFSLRLQALKELEDRAIERLVGAVEQQDYRFRPSALIPVIHCSSTALGTFLSLFGDDVSSSYTSGVKIAIADYYNDQIREIYADKPDETRLKEVSASGEKRCRPEPEETDSAIQLFKAARDEELEYVDQHTPEALDPTKEDTNTVRSFAKNATKVLLQASRVV